MLLGFKWGLLIVGFYRIWQVLIFRYLDSIQANVGFSQIIKNKIRFSLDLGGILVGFLKKVGF